MKAKYIKRIVTGVAILTIFAVQIMGVKITAYADEATTYSQEGELFILGDQTYGRDYVFTGSNGFFLSPKVWNNGDSPYPTTAPANQVTDATVSGIYTAGHVFDCQYGSKTTPKASGLADPRLNGALSANEYVKLEYASGTGADTKYKLTLYRKTGASQTGNVSAPAPHTHSYEWAEETSASENSDGEMVYRCECGDVLYRVPISAYGVFNKNVADKIRNAKQGEMVKIETRKWISFHKMVMQALSERPDVSLEVSFLEGEYRGNRLSFIIPAGIDTMSLVDENGYSGFLYLYGQLGSK